MFDILSQLLNIFSFNLSMHMCLEQTESLESNLVFFLHINHIKICSNMKSSKCFETAAAE